MVDSSLSPYWQPTDREKDEYRRGRVDYRHWHAGSPCVVLHTDNVHFGRLVITHETMKRRSNVHRSVVVAVNQPELNVPKRINKVNLKVLPCGCAWSLFPSSILLYRARNRLTLSILLLFNDVVPMQFSMAVVNQVDRRPIKRPFISMRNSYPERKVKEEKSLFDIPWHDRQLLVSAVVRSTNNKRPERERERESGQRHGRSAYDHLQKDPSRLRNP